jgi:hypothetical protein
LILALAYVTVIGVTVAALTTWASGDLNNTNNFTSGRNLDYSLSSAVEVAINNIRYAPEADSVNVSLASGPVACWGSGSTSTYELPGSTNNIATWCSTLSDPGTATTRTVTIAACVASTSNTACALAPQLQAVIVFDDYSATGQPANGEGATLESWDWSSKAGLSVALPNSINVNSTPPAFPLVGGTYVTSASATSGDTVAITTSNSAICRVSAGVVSFVANGACTVYFNDPGNVNYAGAVQVSQTMSVGPVANAITVNSTAPSSATVGGSTYTPVAAATSGDVVAVTSSTTAVCTVSSGVVTFIGAGTGTATCTLAFNDPGNTDYVAATQVTQSFSVTVGVPAGVSVLAYSSTPNGNPNNGDQVTYTYNQTMNGSSLLSGFSGSSTAVYVQLSRSNGSSTVWKVCATTNCSTAVNLGSVNLGDGGSPGYYVQTAGNTVVYNATMSMSTVSGESVVTVVLGSTVSGTVSVLSPSTTQTTLVWTPSASATGSATGTNCSTTSVTEANAPQRNF